MSDSQPEETAPEMVPPDAPEEAPPSDAPESSPPKERPPRHYPDDIVFNGPNDRRLSHLMNEIAAQLGESEMMPKNQIRALLFKYGLKKVREWVAQVFEIEANGGMMTNDGSRKRTPGGIFFYISGGGSRYVKRPKNAPRPFPRETALPMVEKALQHLGEVSEPVKVHIVGRPTRVEHVDEVCVMTLQEQKQPQSISTLLPAWPEQATTYVVYILWETWNKVDRRIRENPAMEVMMEGEMAFDAELGQIIVFGQRVQARVKLTPEEKEAQKQAQLAREAELKPAREAKKADQKEKKEAAKIEKQMQRLQALNKAVEEAEAKLEQIRALPPSQQQGMFTAMRAAQAAKEELRKFREEAQKQANAGGKNGEA